MYRTAHDNMNSRFEILCHSTIPIWKKITKEVQLWPCHNKCNIPEAMTTHDRNSTSSDSSRASTVNCSAAYSLDLAATINQNHTKLTAVIMQFKKI